MSDNNECCLARGAASIVFGLIADPLSDDVVLDVVTSMLKGFPDLIHQRDEQGRYPVEAAVHEGQAYMLRLLIHSSPFYLGNKSELLRLLDLARNANQPKCIDAVQEELNLQQHFFGQFLGEIAADHDEGTSSGVQIGRSLLGSGLYTARSETADQAASTVFEAIAGPVCDGGVLDLVKSQLQKFPRLIHHRDELGRNPVEAAILEGKVDVARLLIHEHPWFLYSKTPSGETLLDLARAANQPLCIILVQEELNRIDARQVFYHRIVRASAAPFQDLEEGTSYEVWSLLLGIMAFIGGATFAVPLNFHNIYPLSSMEPVKTVHLSILELFTFPSATTEGFFLLTTDTAAFILSMLGILYSMRFIRRKWPTWGSFVTAFSLLIIALTSLSFCAMLNKLVPNFITVDGGHVKVPGALVVVLYSIYVMLLLILLYYVQRVICGAFSKCKRVDLESGGERQMSMVRALRNESGRVQHNTSTDTASTNESSREQRNRSTDLASANESSRVQSHRSTAVAPENESGSSAVPAPSNESSRVQCQMNTAPENDSARVHFNSSKVPAPSNESSRVQCHMSMAPAPRN